MAQQPQAGSQGDGFVDVEAAAAVLAEGGIVIVVDAHDRENEGDLVVAAEHATPEAINFMAIHGRGLICVPMLQERLEELSIPAMVAKSTDSHGTAFHVGVDHIPTNSTGISASDRAHTARALADSESRASEFAQPGHVFPLAYREGGVLKRAGHTEAAIDLTAIAGLAPAAVICEIAEVDGEMARLPGLQELAARHGLPIVAISDLIDYRRGREKLVVRVSEATLPIDEREFRAIGYRDLITGIEHLALVLGDVAERPGALVRVHSECLTGDVFGSGRCDCGPQLQMALAMIAAEGRGAVVYLRGHEGRGIGLVDKLHAYRLQDEGLDTVDANLSLGHPVDRREYGTGMQILADLGIAEMRLLTNNPAKRAGLEGYGLRVSDRVPLVTPTTPTNERYLRTKRERLGHMLGEGVDPA